MKIEFIRVKSINGDWSEWVNIEDHEKIIDIDKHYVAIETKREITGEEFDNFMSRKFDYWY